jgi:hypothetical protein
MADEIKKEAPVKLLKLLSTTLPLMLPLKPAAPGTTIG